MTWSTLQLLLSTVWLSYLCKTWIQSQSVQFTFSVTSGPFLVFLPLDSSGMRRKTRLPITKQTMATFMMLAALHRTTGMQWSRQSRRFTLRHQLFHSTRCGILNKPRAQDTFGTAVKPEKDLRRTGNEKNYVVQSKTQWKYTCKSEIKKRNVFNPLWYLKKGMIVIIRKKHLFLILFRIWNHDCSLVTISVIAVCWCDLIGQFFGFFSSLFFFQFHWLHWLENLSGKQCVC